jgi:hypothetical protein
LNRDFLILQAIDAIAEVVRAKKECDAVRQEFDHARVLLLEAVQSKNDLMAFLMALRNRRTNHRMSAQAESRILKQVAIMLRDQLHFSKACEAILDRTEV